MLSIQLLELLLIHLHLSKGVEGTTLILCLTLGDGSVLSLFYSILKHIDSLCDGIVLTLKFVDSLTWVNWFLLCLLRLAASAAKKFLHHFAKISVYRKIN